MKEKLLALILVLGMSSMTNATLSLVVGDGTTFTDPGDDFTIAIGDTIWIGINDSVGTMYLASISNELTSTGEWTGNSAVYSPPAVSTAPGWTYGSNDSREWWYVDLRDPFSDETPLPGVGCAVEFRGLNAGKEGIGILLNLCPGGYDDVFVLHIVPEPTTVILLALGSLALIRCRR